MLYEDLRFPQLLPGLHPEDPGAEAFRLTSWRIKVLTGGETVGMWGCLSWRHAPPFSQGTLR